MHLLAIIHRGWATLKWQVAYTKPIWIAYMQIKNSKCDFIRPKKSAEAAFHQTTMRAELMDTLEFVGDDEGPEFPIS
jgi:hypothetical protein